MTLKYVSHVALHTGMESSASIKLSLATFEVGQPIRSRLKMF